MMRIGGLSPAELARTVAGPGLFFETGPFVMHVQSPIPALASHLGLLYADYVLHRADSFADVHIEVTRARGLRRWIRPQAEFVDDGYRPFKPLPLNQAHPLMEWGANWSISSRFHHYLIVHAAVVEKQGRAVMLPAPAGSGKSTLCALLTLSGWRLLTDELALIRPSDGWVAPMPRPVSLKNRSIDVIREFAPGATLSVPVHDTTKGTVAHLKPQLEHIDAAKQCVPLAAVVFPRYMAGSEAVVSALTRAQAFMRVAQNAFNYDLLGEQGFELLTGVMSTTRNVEFSYSRTDDALRAFDTLIN